jgi:benzylsuccinate CoA-transferase BbsE subunit
MSAETPVGALDDLRVLDLTTPLGAYCTKLLADLGAEVIRVEPPSGDPGRAVGPFVGDVPHPDRGIPFLFMNSNKRSVTLDLETADGQALFRRLAASADVIVESFAPGYLDRLGLGHADLARDHPGLIVTSISPFGRDGPYRDYQATDLIGVAMGGLLRLCGFPGQAPDRPGGDQAYMLAGLHGCAGTLVALYHRDRTGAGQHVDVSMQQAVFLGTGYIVHWAEMRGVDLNRGGDRYNDSPGTFRMMFPCKDGWIVGGVGTRDREFQNAVEWMESWDHHSDLTGPEWADRAYRREHWAYAERVWSEFALRHTKEELYAEAQARRMTLMPVLTAEEIERDPHLQARGFFQQVEHPRLGPLTYPGPAFRPSGTPLRPPAAAPEAGGDNVAIFGDELGLTRASLRALQRAGVI